MDIAKQNLIITRFPALYRKTLPFGFECGDGWLDILLSLSEKLEKAANKAGITVGSEAFPYATQVKSKFAMLSWYGENLTDEMQTLINKASNISRHTCEICGAPGKVRIHKRWYAVYCDQHAPNGSILASERLAAAKNDKRKRVHQVFS